MQTTTLALVVALAAGLAAPADASCRDCGTVSGSISVEMATLRIDGTKHDRDVVIMLEPADGSAPLSTGAHATMDQSGLVFVPHVLAVAAGTTVTFLNSDNEQHNVYFLDDRTGRTLDIGTWGPGVSVDHTFDTPGMVITLCKLHLEMAAYVVVSPSPWFVQVALETADAPVRFEIADVPAGEYELSAWHKKLKQKGGSVTIDVQSETPTEVDLVITKAKYARAAR
ncbi:MAG: cupredoxin domain-containing protein [Planctomycetota bacterium]|jgi:plastocyanin